MIIMKSKNLPKKLNRRNKSVTNISYHIIWTVKYRKKILIGEVELYLKQLIIEKAVQINLIVKAIECDNDHIHIFLVSNPTITISDILKYLKGFSSYHLRSKFPKLKRMKSLWTPSYYCETIGNINQQTIINYINNQKNT